MDQDIKIRRILDFLFKLPDDEACLIDTESINQETTLDLSEVEWIIQRLAKKEIVKVTNREELFDEDLGKVIRYELIINKKELDKYAQSESKTLEETISELVSKNNEDYFSLKTGVGVFHGVRKSLRLGSKPFQTFCALGRNGGELSRNQILEILGLSDGGDYRSQNTFAINDLVKSIRITTGLSKEELIQSGSNIFLEHHIRFDKD